MQYDIFFSISQTPVDGHLPTEQVMFSNFFEQVRAADELGFGVAWVAESHLSSEMQKRNEQPVIPHWQGEVGLNVDITQLAHQIFAKTRRIEVGSAVMNILCNGGPIAAAERIAYFLALHGVVPEEKRRLHVGFAAGRFEFMNRAYGIKPRNALEVAAWPALKGKVFAEAAEIFVRLLRGDTICSDDIHTTTLRREDFRSEDDWLRTQDAAGTKADAIDIPRRFEFEHLKLVPQQLRRELFTLTIGSHDPKLQNAVNQLYPVRVFNLSITQTKIIEETHRRMSEVYHADGGPWQRSYMPRTVFVFINEEPGLSAEDRRERAQAESRTALGAYWTALEGTLDPAKVEKAADNALIGNANDIADEIVARYHPEERLMLWFDFFNHDSTRVIRNMQAFMEKVAPQVREKLAAKEAST